MTKDISIERILKELYQISGYRISIYDTFFNEIAAYPQNLGCLCSLFQQKKKKKKHTIFSILGRLQTI